MFVGVSVCVCRRRVCVKLLMCSDSEGAEPTERNKERERGCVRGTAQCVCVCVCAFFSDWWCSFFFFFHYYHVGKQQFMCNTERGKTKNQEKKRSSESIYCIAQMCNQKKKKSWSLTPPVGNQRKEKKTQMSKLILLHERKKYWRQRKSNWENKKGSKELKMSKGAFPKKSVLSQLQASSKSSTKLWKPLKRLPASHPHIHTYIQKKIKNVQQR